MQHHFLGKNVSVYSQMDKDSILEPSENAPALTHLPHPVILSPFAHKSSCHNVYQLACTM